MDYLNEIILVRGIERLLIVLFSGCSIILGWNLFKIGITTKQSGEIKANGLLIRLTKVGPGVFFALFGCFVLIQSLYSPFTYNDLPKDYENNEKQELDGKGINFSYFSENSDRYLLLSKSINTISIEIQKIPNLKDRELIERSIRELEEERNLWIINIYGIEGLRLWNTRGMDFLVEPQHFSEEEQNVLRVISEWMVGSIE